MSEEPTRRVPLGKRLTAQELDELAEMTPEQIAEVQAWWNRVATPTGRALLNARAVVSRDGS